MYTMFRGLGFRVLGLGFRDVMGGYIEGYWKRKWKLLCYRVRVKGPASCCPFSE